MSSIFIFILCFNDEGFSDDQAEDTENLISELARVIGGERALIEECGNLLSKTYTTQVCYTSILLVSMR